jgi:hypothetical protein
MSHRKSILTVTLSAGLAFAAGLIAAPSRPAQPEQPEMDFANMPGMSTDEHHEALTPLIGEWKGKVKFWMTPDAEPMESEGTVTREWTMDGRFVIEHVTGSMPDDPEGFKGMGLIGYNTVEGRYETIWIENMATYVTMMTGEMEDSGKSMTFTGDVLDPMTGARLHSRHTLDMSNPRRHVSEGFCTGPDGKEFKNFEGVMERVR